MHHSETLVIGTVIKAPEQMTGATSGKTYVQLRIAENRPMPDGQEEQHVYFTVSVYGEKMMDAVLKEVEVGNGITCKLKIVQSRREQKVNDYWTLLFFNSYPSKKQMAALKSQITSLQAQVKSLKLQLDQ